MVEESKETRNVWTIKGLAAEGLYGVTFIPRKTAALKKLLGMPEDYEVATMVPIGYPSDYFAKTETRLAKRKGTS